VKSNSTEFVPTVVDKRVYVEGVTKGSRAAGEEVKLVWVSYFRASSDSALTNKDFTTNDRPAMQATDKMKVTINGVNDSPAVFALIDNFELSFAVATTEEPSNPAKTYTQRAVAEWHFDGSGTLTPVTPLGGGIWTRTPGARNDGASAFTEVTSGLRPRATTGDDMNWINDTKGFVMVNQ
jgi:hypothetical protein